MNFNRHSNLEGLHAILSPSQNAWLRYDDEKFINVYRNKMAALRGTELHEYAAKAIKLKRKQPRTKDTVNMYINDAIGYRMTPEQVLYFSEYCFGTADAICFNDNLLRIHDLKTGVTPVKIEQLEIYAALFCMEYHIKPGDIKMELRIYKDNEILYHKPEADEILPIMDKIIRFDKKIREINEEEK